MDRGFIKLDRGLLNWEWKDVPEMVAVWIEILLQANYQDQDWHGKRFERGSFPTSLDKLAMGTGLSVRQVRTCLEKLKKTGEIVVEATNHGTKISVINWALYQDNCNDDDKQMTSNRQADDKQPTTLKERKKERRKEIERNKERNPSFLPPTVEEVYHYCKERNNNVDAEQFVDFYTAKNWFVGKNKMKDWKAAVRTWEKRNNSKPTPRNEGLEIYDATDNPVFTESQREALLKRRERMED